MTASVGIVVGNNVRNLPHWIYLDANASKFNIFPTTLNVGYYKIRITGKDAFFGEAYYDIELEVYQLPGLPPQSVEFNLRFEVSFVNRFTSALKDTEKYTIQFKEETDANYVTIYENNAAVSNIAAGYDWVTFTNATRTFSVE